jgi:glucose-6-phosphate isomerase
MAISLRYDATAAHSLFDPELLADIEPELLRARADVLHDVRLWESGDPVPADKQPLDAGFITLPARLLQEAEDDGSASLLGRIEAAAGELREEIDRLLVLGIGGSYMGARALFEALCHPYHNELEHEERRGAPRLYFEGNNIDNDAVAGLLELLRNRCQDKTDFRQRWALTVISKSGGTIETAVAFRIFRKALEEYYGEQSPESTRYVVPITGETGKLRKLAQNRQYPSIFPIPEGVGGRFSIFTAVGLFPAAMLGIDIRQLLQGAADMTAAFRKQPLGSNPVLDYTATCHILERENDLNIRVLSTWGKRLEAVGLWYDQLLAESLGKDESGATPLTVVNTRDLHSRGQQHQEGMLDKLITNVVVESPASDPIAIPTAADDADDLNRLSDKTLPDLLSAALEGTNQAYADVDRPTHDIILPHIDAHTIGQLLQMLMLATVVEGRLIDINPYGQPGVEAYKQNMAAILNHG